MTGVLFIINVPQKEHEASLIKSKKVQDKILEITKDDRRESKFYLGYSSDASVPVHCVDKADSLKSWKDVIRSRKLKITRPIRGADIAEAFDWNTPLETVLSDVMNRLEVKNATWCATQNKKFWQVTFSLESGRNCEELLQVLKTFGIGSRHQSALSIIPCTRFYGTHRSDSVGKCENVSKSPWSRFSSSRQARTNLAQVLQSVRADAAVTFDWCFLLLVAALVASIGLVEDSTVVLVASMLISPLMGPITAGSIGTAVRDRSLQMIGFTHELLGLSMCLAIGFIFGLALCTVDGQLNIMNDWPTEEMTNRCEYRSLWVGMLVAIPSGAGVALAVLGDYTASLVGVAISASLLPPAVNAGLLWAMSVYRMISSEEEPGWRVEDSFELAVLGSRSLCLTLVNIVCIFCAGVAVYKMKNVSSLEKRNISWWRANQSQLQALQSQKENKATWDISKWSNVQTVNSDLTVQETVTFRRPHVLQRMKAQSIEDCLRNAQMDKNYQPLDSETVSESQNSDSTKSNDTSNTSLPDYCFYNLGCESDLSPEICPTIEPSQCFTLETKR